MINPAILHELKNSADLLIQRTPVNDTRPPRDQGSFDNLLDSQIRKNDEIHDNNFRTESREQARHDHEYAAQSRPVQDSRTGNEDRSVHNHTDRQHDKSDKEALNSRKEEKNGPDTRESSTIVSMNKKQSVENTTLTKKTVTAIAADKMHDVNTSPKDLISDAKKLLEKLDALGAMLAGVLNMAGRHDSQALKSSLKEIRRELQEIATGKHPDRKDIQAQLMAHLKSILKGIDEKLDSRKPDLKQIVADLDKILQKMTRKTEGRDNIAPHQNLEAASGDKKIQQRFDITENNLSQSMEKHGEGIRLNVSTDSRPSMDFNFDRNTVSQAHNSTVSNTAPQRTTLFREQLQDVIDNAKVTVRDSRNGSFEIRLNPRELGSVNIHLGLEQGTITGKFLVETGEAKQLLLENLSYVKEQLENAGISVGEFQVNVRDNSGSSDNGERDVPAYLPAETEEMSGSYVSNSSALHNGALNIVI